ncbi:MAG TPA: ROK family transcriptional regulator [Acidimicrobiales bacterium]|nr:ROK family transcriptional regulator [Acidimicrobiales bacterium]
MASGRAASPQALTAGALFQLVREGHATSRAELARATGLARSTVSQRIDELLGHGLLVERGDGPSTGGRPPSRLVFDAGSGVVLCADLGATHCRLAVSDLACDVLTERSGDMAIDAGPETVLASVQDRFDDLLAEAGRSRADVRGIGIGLPGPVEFAAGRAVSPPIMPGWDGVPVPDAFAGRFTGVPVLVDNDVNVMALGEYWASWRHSIDDLLFVKVATGIGCGIITGGDLHRGADGTAGDLGHIQVPDAGDALCRCGNRGCVEAVASGGAIAQQLREQGIEADGSRDVVALVRAGDPQATALVRQAGRLVGEVLAGAVNFFNPAVIVIGGDVAHAHEQFFAGVREVVYRRSTALATQHLQVARSRLDDRAGVIGCAVTVTERILSAAAVDDALAATTAEEATA